MTTTYFAPPQHFQGEVVTLPLEEAQHAVKVLRKQVGDEIVVIDGVGGWHRVELQIVGKDRALGRILESQYEIGEPQIKITVGLALLKNANRFEEFAEKAVELGVTEIVPLLTQRTEVSKLKLDRLQRILIAAMKQSGRTRLPILHSPTAFKQIVAQEADLKLICHEQTALSESLFDVHPSPEMQKITMLVGPEGGFSESEIEMAKAHQYQPVSLGKRRLRAETAAIIAASSVLMWD